MEKLLIANRAEIAVRIARSARELGIRTVAVVSEADANAMISRVADEIIVVGPAPAGASYLNQDAILDAARSTGADAIHPGYGFLSENAAFARRVVEAGLIWVGPEPESIEIMGDKVRAIEAARAAGVPVLQGSGGELAPEDDAIARGREVGYPLLIKASAGGGGRGIRLVESEADLVASLEQVRGEAASAFGDPTVYLERFVADARHVEVQLLADGVHAVHLGDRDCSMQRRSQKVIEEAPAPGLPDDVRERMRSSSVALAEATGYRGAGTVEFLYDPARGEAAFIEMNTRLQVEHPVTEAITGIDLVAAQLRIADGEPLGFTQDDIAFAGHAIECRINAEDPARGFFPSPGLITRADWSPAARVDAGFAAGDTVTPYYDSLVAKVIVHADTRDEAIAETIGALEESLVEGISTTIPLHIRLLATREFWAVAHHTKFIESEPALLGGR